MCILVNMFGYLEVTDLLIGDILDRNLIHSAKYTNTTKKMILFPFITNMDVTKNHTNMQTIVKVVLHWRFITA